MADAAVTGDLLQKNSGPIGSYLPCLVLAVTASEPASVWLLLGRTKVFELEPSSLQPNPANPSFPHHRTLLVRVLSGSPGSSYVVGFLTTVPARLCPLSGEVLSNSLSCPMISTVTVGPVWRSSWYIIYQAPVTSLRRLRSYSLSSPGGKPSLV